MDIQMRMKQSDANLVRLVLQEEAVRVHARAKHLEDLIPKVEQRLQDLRAEQRITLQRLDQLIGDEEHGRPGLVLVFNEQLNLFASENPPGFSASLGRRGHPAPIRATV